jgi:hypothetical protein
MIEVGILCGLNSMGRGKRGSGLGLIPFFHQSRQRLVFLRLVKLFHTPMDPTS